MKFLVYEQVLNEYVNHPVSTLVGEFQAETFEEARRLAKQARPGLVAMKITDETGAKTVEYFS